MRSDRNERSWTAQDVASSNSTLNKLMGGKQKAWMADGYLTGTIARPSPRPEATQRPSAPPNLPILPSPAPSEEPSPLAQDSPAVDSFNNRIPSSKNPPFVQEYRTVMVEENGQLPIADDTRSPSLIVSTTYAPSAARTQASPLPRAGSATPRTDAAAIGVQAQADEPTPAASMPFETTSRRPSLQEQQVHISEEQPQNLESFQFSQYPQDVNWQVNSTNRPQLPETLPEGVNTQHEPIRQQIQHIRRRLVQEAHDSQQASQPLPQAKRQRTQEPSLSMKSHVALIDGHIYRTGGIAKLTAKLEQPRFTLLRDACEKDDQFYVALHQIFCAWTLRSNLNELGPRYQGPEIADGFRILGMLIRDNDHMTLVHLKFFADFPSPLGFLMPRSEQYCRRIEEVRVFLTKLSTSWISFNQVCRDRCYPPLVDELIYHLHLLSPILQGVVFTATRRNLGFKDDRYGNQLEKLFRQDREGHAKFALRMHTAYPPSNKEVDERNNILINKYRAVAMQLQQAIQQQSIQQNNYVNHSLPAGPVSVNMAMNAQQLQQFQQHQQRPSLPQQVVSPVSYHSPVQSPLHNFRPQFSDTVVRSQIQSPQSVHSSVPVQSPQNAFHMVPSQTINQHQIPQNSLHSSQHPQHYHGPLQHSHVPQHHPSVQNWVVPSQNQVTNMGNINPTGPSQLPSPNPLQSHTLSRPSLESRPRPNSQTSVSFQQFVPSNAPNVVSPPMRQEPSTASPMNQSPTNNWNKEQWAITEYNTKHFMDRPLVPPHGWKLPLQPPNPDMTAIHQSYLRSPVLTITHANPSPQGRTVRYYQAIRNFAVGPIVLCRNTKVSTFSFIVTDDVQSKLAKTVYSTIPHETAVTRECKVGSFQYRVRCIALKDDAKPSLYEWVTADCKWPQHVFIELNKTVLSVRRKGHYEKDLPIDITTFISPVPAVENQIDIASLPPGSGTRDCNYGFAVEIVEVLEHQQIMDMVTSKNPPPPSRCQRIPASQTIAGINQTLTGSLADDDEEITMVVTDLTIDLADPFMAKIFSVPVRGSTCLHRECFDLETFLTTRRGKATANGNTEVSLVDVWKCPLCGKDARPYSLRVDEFLVGVREKLEMDDMLDCKAILVTADGSWKPKLEHNAKKRSASEAQGNDDDDDETDTNTNEHTGGNLPAKDGGIAAAERDVIVIELDD